MRKLIAIVLIGLISVAIAACGGDSVDPTNTPLPTPATEAPTQAPDTPTPMPTATTAPTNTPAPTSTPAPVPTNTPAPTVVPTLAPTSPPPTAAPEQTATPVPTPAPTATPVPVPTEAPTVAPTPEPEPTAKPEPTATPEPELTENPVAADLAPLGDNLLWVAHFDNRTKEWSVYDPSGTFSPDSLPLVGQDVPDASSIGELSALVPRQIYWLMVGDAQTAVLGGVSRTLVSGLNGVPW